MALYLIDNAIVSTNTVIIKFGRTVKISSLINANFVVQTDSATPSQITSPFKPIQTLTDYNQINRTLTLYWNAVLAANTSYLIRVINIADSSGYVVDEESVKFTSAIESATPTQLEGPKGTIVNEVLIEDKSVRSGIETGYQILAKNPNFYIESVSPSSGEFYINQDENNGRVIINFNIRPASNFMTSQYFKVLRKKIQKTPARWEKVETQISMHSWRPIVYIDFPSIEATPVYYVDGKDYFESGYKYKVIVSAEIGV